MFASPAGISTADNILTSGVSNPSSGPQLQGNWINRSGPPHLFSFARCQAAAWPHSSTSGSGSRSQCCTTGPARLELPCGSQHLQFADDNTGRIDGVDDIDRSPATPGQKSLGGSPSTVICRVCMCWHRQLRSLQEKPPPLGVERWDSLEPFRAHFHCSVPLVTARCPLIYYCSNGRTNRLSLKKDGHSAPH